MPRFTMRSTAYTAHVPLPYTPQALRGGRLRGVGHPQLLGCLQRWLRESRLPTDTATTVYKQRPHQLWSVPCPPQLALPFTHMVVKRFGWRNPQHYLCSPLTRSKAQKEFRTACHLLKHGLLTATPLGACEMRRWGFVQANVYVMENIADGMTLRDYWATRPDGQQGLDEVIRLAADYTRRMHDSGLWHRDLYIANFLVAGVAGTRRLYLVDLSRARRVGYMPAWLRAIDLGRMEYLARHPQFLAVYCAGRFKPQYLVRIVRWHERWRAWRRRFLHRIDPLRRRLKLKS